VFFISCCCVKKKYDVEVGVEVMGLCFVVGRLGKTMGKEGNKQIALDGSFYTAMFCRIDYPHFTS
jgi:hypothetical protein